MSLKLKELKELERLLTTTATLDGEAWQHCFEAVEGGGCPGADGLRKFFELAARLGPSHLEAVRQFEQEEMKKGVIDNAAGW